MIDPQRYKDVVIISTKFPYRIESEANLEF